MMNTYKTQKIASNVFWRFGERILAQGVSLAVSMVLAHFLLPEEYGAIAIVLIFIAFADVFATSGFSAALIQKRDAKFIDFDTIFYCSLVISILIYIVLFLTAPVIAGFYEMPTLVPVLRVFSLRIVLGSYNSVQHAYVSRHLMFKKFFFSTLFGTIISGVIGILMALSGFGIWSLVAQYLSNTVIDSIVLSITIKWHPRLRFSRTSAKGLIRYGWKVLAANFSGTFFDQLRSALIGKFYTSSDLAYYNKGQQFSSTIIGNSSTAIMEVLFPAISNEGNNFARVKIMTQRAVIIASYLVLPLAFGLCAMAEPFILFFFTEAWSDTILFMQLLCIASAISLVSNISLQTIKATGRSDILLKLEFIKKPIYIVTLLAGLCFSTIGVAISAIIYAVYSTIVNSYAMGKIIDYPVREQIKDMFPNLILGILIGLCMFLTILIQLPNIATLFIQLAVGIVAFVVLSCVLKLPAYRIVSRYIKNKIRSKNVEI